LFAVAAAAAAAAANVLSCWILPFIILDLCAIIVGLILPVWFANY